VNLDVSHCMTWSCIDSAGCWRSNHPGRPMDSMRYGQFWPHVRRPTTIDFGISSVVRGRGHSMCPGIKGILHMRSRDRMTVKALKLTSPVLARRTDVESPGTE
jgi:hypothetical protein